jgi:hypothetical protein
MAPAPRRVRVLHGNQPHFMRRLRASIAAARVHTQLPLPGSRSNAGQLNLPLQSADYHQTVAAPTSTHPRPRGCLSTFLLFVAMLCTLISISISPFFESFVTSTRSLLAAITQPIVKSRAVGHRYSVKPGPLEDHFRVPNPNPPPNSRHASSQIHHFVPVNFARCHTTVCRSAAKPEVVNFLLVAFVVTFSTTSPLC